MLNPLKDPVKNPLKMFYERFWVPIFGRMLHFFSSLIEGQQLNETSTFNLREDESGNKGRIP